MHAQAGRPTGSALSCVKCLLASATLTGLLSSRRRRTKEIINLKQTTLIDIVEDHGDKECMSNEDNHSDNNEGSDIDDWKNDFRNTHSIKGKYLR